MGLLLCGALLVQVEVMHYLVWRNAEASAVLVLAVWYALHADWRRAAVFGLIAGACEDALSAQTGGAWTIATTLTAIFANTLVRWFFADSVPVAAAIVFAATLLRSMLFWIVMALQNYPPGYARLHLHEALWSALMNAALIAVALAVARRFDREAM